MKFLFTRSTQETVVVESSDPTEAYIAAVSGEGKGLGDCRSEYHHSPYFGGYGAQVGLMPMPTPPPNPAPDTATSGVIEESQP